MLCSVNSCRREAARDGFLCKIAAEIPFTALPVLPGEGSVQVFFFARLFLSVRLLL